jgi:hypothetical protein
MLILLAMAIAIGAPLKAQPAPIFRAHTTEIGGFVGASYGIDQARIMGGGNVSYAIIKEVLPFAEVSYFPGIGRTGTVSGLAGATGTFTIPITDFNFGVHLRLFRIPKSPIVPYIVMSFGGIHNGEYTAQIHYTDPASGQAKTASLPVAAATTYATSVGGGLRYYVGEHYGFRGEFKAYIPGNNLDKFYRATGGFFYQF